MKNIKWNKGLFRIWIIISALWIIASFLDIFTSSKSNSYDAGDWLLVFGGYILLPPVLLLILFVICQKILKWIIEGFKK